MAERVSSLKSGFEYKETRVRGRVILFVSPTDITKQSWRKVHSIIHDYKKRKELLKQFSFAIEFFD